MNINIFTIAISTLFTSLIMQDKVLKILAKYSILPEAVGDIIFKDGSVMFTVDIGVLELDKNEAEKSEKSIALQYC